MEAGGGTVWKMDVYGLRQDHHNCKPLQEGNKIVGIWRVEFLTEQEYMSKSFGEEAAFERDLNFFFFFTNQNSVS